MKPTLPLIAALLSGCTSISGSTITVITTVHDDCSITRTDDVQGGGQGGDGAGAGQLASLLQSDIQCQPTP